MKPVGFIGSRMSSSSSSLGRAVEVGGFRGSCSFPPKSISKVKTPFWFWQSGFPLFLLSLRPRDKVGVFCPACEEALETWEQGFSVSALHCKTQVGAERKQKTGPRFVFNYLIVLVGKWIRFLGGSPHLPAWIFLLQLSHWSGSAGGGCPAAPEPMAPVSWLANPLLFDSFFSEIAGLVILICFWKRPINICGKKSQETLEAVRAGRYDFSLPWKNLMSLLNSALSEHSPSCTIATVLNNLRGWRAPQGEK